MLAGAIAGALARGAVGRVAAETIPGRSPQPRIVIGENQFRVDDVAATIGGETISDWLRTTGRVWSPAANQQWLEQMKSNRAVFYDIGPDFDRRLMNRMDSESGRPPSKIYGSERKGLSGYPDYIRLYDRAGKYEGAVQKVNQ